MISKPYDEAVAVGVLHDWQENDRADPERFDRNNRYLADTLHAIENATERRLDQVAKGVADLARDKADAQAMTDALAGKAEKHHRHSLAGLRWRDFEEGAGP